MVIGPLVIALPRLFLVLGLVAAMLATARGKRSDVRFLFVNQGEGKATIRKYLAAENLDLRNVLLDTGRSVSRHFGVRGLTSTLFFNGDGELVSSHLGMLPGTVLSDYLHRLQAAEQQIQ